MLLPPPFELAGRYRVEAVIGRGGASTVYRAWDLVAAIPVAVKIAATRLDDDTARRFEREAAALSVVASDHVVAVLAAGRSAELDDVPYLVMELLEGSDLQAELELHGPAAPVHVVAWFEQAARALDLAHGVGIAHRDLKPGNLFLHRTAGGGQVAQPPGPGRILKVLDFGLVKQQDETRADPDLFVGTPLYMAPEQVRGHGARVGPATDVWGMGLVALTLLTGEPYWRRLDRIDILDDITTAPMYRPSERWSWLPPQFDAWFARSCHRVAEKRFAQVGQQARALARALAELAAPARTHVPVRRDDTLYTVSRSVVRPEGDPTAAPLRPLVGRVAELRELGQRLRTSPAGTLITVTGPAGSGKTLLASHAAAEASDRFPDGLWFVPLTGVRRTPELHAALARCLGAEPESRAPLASLVGRRALLLLDGLEHVDELRACLAELRGQAPSVTWLVSSRVPLGVDGEACVLAPPLDAPPPSVTAEEAVHYDAVELFVRRARELVPGLTVTAENVGEVTAVVRDLDGLPLALELAAAQLGRLTLGELSARTARGSERPLERTIASSYELLGEPERLVVRRLAVFAGAAPAAAERVLAGDVTDAPAILQALVHRNFLAYSADDEPRLSMLETVREFALARLREAGEEPLARARWLDHLLELASGATGDSWLARLDVEKDNLREALAYTLRAEPETGLRLAGALAEYWYLRGFYREGSGWLDEALARTGDAVSEPRQRALRGAGELAFLQCRYAQAAALLERSAAMAVERGDDRGVAAAEQRLGSIARELGDYAAAGSRHERARQVWARLGDGREEARSWNFLAFAGWLGAGDLNAAEQAVGRAGDGLVTLGDEEGIVWTHLNRGGIALQRGKPEAASRWFAAAFAAAVAARYQEGIAWALDRQGVCSIHSEEWLHAEARLRASLRIHRRLGDRWRSASVLEALASVALATGDAGEAAALLGNAAEVRRQIGAPIPACERPMHDATTARALALLDHRYSAAFRGGGAATDEDLRVGGRSLA